MRKIILFPLILLCGCGQYVEDRKSEDYAPIYLGIDDTQDVQAIGAIYTPNKNGLFAMESRAHRVGDILTVSFTESFQATKSQNAASTKSSDSKVTLPNILENLAEELTWFQSQQICQQALNSHLLDQVQATSPIL